MLDEGRGRSLSTLPRTHGLHLVTLSPNLGESGRQKKCFSLTLGKRDVAETQSKLGTRKDLSDVNMFHPH